MATFRTTPDGCLMQVFPEGDKHIELPAGIWRIGPKGYIQSPFRSTERVESVVIPEGVKEIGANAFMNMGTLKSVTLPSTLERIEGSAFMGCDSLEEINLPEGLETILIQAFFGCKTLKKLELPATLNTVGDRAFSYCSGLQEITGLRREHLASVGVFTGCDSLADKDGFVILEDVLYGYVGKATEATIPDTVTRIDYAAFIGNDRITSFVIPDSVEELGQCAFKNCKALTTVRFPAGLKEIPWGCFEGCEALARIEVPASVKTIERASFVRCAGLKELVLSEGLEVISDSAFAECPGLTEVKIPDSVKELCGFSACENLEKINIPARLKKIGNFDGCKKITSLILPKGVELPYFGFGKKMLIHYTATFERPWQAKEKNPRLWSETPVVLTIGTGDTVAYKILLCDKFEKLVAFDKKGNLSWKTYDALLCGSDLKLAAPFGSLAMLYRLRWPQELEEGRRELFIAQVTKDIKKLAPYVNLVPGDGLIKVLEQIGALTEKNKKTLLPLMGIGETPAPKKKAEKKPEAEALPDGVKTPAQIKKEWNTKKLADGTLWLTSYKGTDTVVEIPAVIGKDAVTVVGNECFSCSSWCRASAEQVAVRKKITAVVIPEGITQIGESAFRECEALETVTFPSTLKTIGECAFLSCKRLKKADVPVGVELGDAAFRYCSELADEQGMVIRGGILFGAYVEGDVVIPDTVKRVESRAFLYLKNLTSVKFPEGLKTLVLHTIENCPNLKSVTIPPSVTKIEHGALPEQQITVYGYINSTAEAYCKDVFSRRLTFSSIGVLEPENGDFVITDGVLTEYKGSDETVTIPEGVTIIGHRPSGGWGSNGAFHGNETIRHLVIPEGVELIDSYVFTGCVNLETIQFPSSLVKVGSNAFQNTKWLVEHPEGPVYAGSVLINYIPYKDKTQAPETLVIPEGIRVIGDSALGSRTGSTKKIVLPSTLETICSGAFRYSSVEELVVPASVKELEDYAFEYVDGIKRCSGGVLHKKEKLPAKFKIFYTGEPEDTAWVTLYQGEPAWRKAVKEKLEAQPDTVPVVMELLAKMISEMDTLDKAAGNRAAAIAQELYKTAMGEPVKALYDALKKKNHPMVKKLEADSDFMAALEGGGGEDLSKLHPVEAMVVEALKPTPAFDRVVNRILEPVPYAGTEELCAPRVLAYIVYEYIRQYKPEDTKFVSTYETACTAYQWSEVADKAAAALDQGKLIEALRQLAERYEGEYYIPYARYADDKTAVAILSKMREWDNWGKYAATGRKHIMIARSGLLLNDTKAAMIHMDKVGQLEEYARLRGTDAATLRDTVLADFGFDENREIRYDLGGNTVVISMDTELNLTIFDTNAGKIVKSIPKKGADAALHEQAKTAFSDLKKNIKKVITNRKHLLFADFLSGAKKDAEAWKKAYMGNPVLNSVARLVVWQQGGKTFTLTMEGTVDAQGNPYTITGEPIAVAHPIEMRGEIAAWQTYFTENGLKQPFEQVWEPAYDPAEIKPDRYEGCSLNVYRLANKEAHGIRVWGLQAYSEEYGFELKDCKMEQEGSEWRFVSGITDDATFNLGKFTFEKFTRYVNHIVYLFDKWTVSGRLLNGDTSVEPLLKAFTAAQIREFVKLTTEKELTEVTAMLLQYQTEHFAEFDPLAEFTLDL